MRTLVVTNDFPPRVGGIQSFVHQLALRQPAGEIVVYASRWRGWEEFDAAQPFPVVREDTSILLPTPAVSRRAAEILRAEDCDRVWFGAMAPLGLLSDGLRAKGAQRLLASTHGHEIGWGRLPVARQLLIRSAKGIDVVTYLGDYTRERLAGALAGSRLERLPPGVDTSVFRPDADGAGVRREHGLGDRPVVTCVSRLVPRKGQDTLLRALPEIRRRVPGAALLLVGDGPYRARLERLAREQGVETDVVFVGSVSPDRLPAYYAAGDVFAMPCRTRHAGLDVEGLGIVYLEASACGRPVVAGDSGGAPDAVRQGETGLVVDGRSVGAVAAAVAGLLADRGRAREMGGKGRAWVEAEWRWDTLAVRLRELLAG